MKDTLGDKLIETYPLRKEMNEKLVRTGHATYITGEDYQPDQMGLDPAGWSKWFIELWTGKVGTSDYNYTSTVIKVHRIIMAMSDEELVSLLAMEKLS